LKTFMRKVTAHLGRCLTALFGTPFRLGALPVLSPMRTPRTSKGLDNFGSLGGAYSYAHSVSLATSATATYDGLLTGWFKEL
jgi:hypothetical protein